MKCRQAQDLMGAYLYGDLAPEEMRELRVHAQDCTLCREDLATRGRVVSSLSDSVPTLSDADRQRIAWSVKGATRRRDMSRPFARRLAFGLVLGVILAGLALGRVALRSLRPSAVLTVKGHELPQAKVDIKETTPKIDKASQLLKQAIDLTNSLAPPAVLPGSRGETSWRHNGLSMRNTEPRQRDSVQMAPDPAPQPKPDNITHAPKDSGINPKNTDTGMDLEGTKLPRVTDPKNAETAPSDAQ